MKTINTDFIPNIHGYKFINLFDLNLLISFTSIFKKRLFIGLCGGMVFSALDYFYSGIICPDYLSPDEFHDKFIDYLWKRQLESISVGTFITLINRGVSSNKKVINHVINKEIPKIIENINQGVPVPVVIVRNRFFENPTNNHQILLVSCTIDGPKTHFKCYDPNHPQQSPLLTISRIIGQESIISSTGEPIRGLFINKYNHQQPYQY